MEIIAYYLPQFHAIPENDEWWGKGFTEWTNVAKARPLFKGHEQPHIPADLGFYNLLHTDVQKAQIELAKEAGVTGFCYWHYWFGNSHQLLEKPIKNVLEHKELDFPFCFGWANESWQAKVWSSRDTCKGNVLIEQLYPGDEDIDKHFDYLESYLQDKRYYRIEDRPVFVIYKPYLLPDIVYFKNYFNHLIKKSGIAESFYFIGYTVNDKEIDDLSQKLDAVNIVRTGCYRFDKSLIQRIPLSLIKYKCLNYPLILPYKKILKFFSKSVDKEENIIPTIIPNWDHTPRSGKKGVVFYKPTPELFAEHVDNVLDSIKNKKNQVAFIKSWNEWGEGNYMEPDTKYGKAFIETLRICLNKLSDCNSFDLNRKHK